MTVFLTAIQPVIDLLGKAAWLLLPIGVTAFFARKTAITLELMRASRAEELEDFKSVKQGLVEESKANIQHFLSEVLEEKRTELRSLEEVRRVKREAILKALAVLDAYLAYRTYMGDLDYYRHWPEPSTPRIDDLLQAASRLTVSCDTVDVPERFRSVFLSNNGDEVAAYEAFVNASRAELGLSTISTPDTGQWLRYTAIYGKIEGAY